MEFVRILSAVAEVFTEPVIIMALFMFISSITVLLKIFDKAREDHKDTNNILVERLKQNDKNNKEVATALENVSEQFREVSVQLKKVATITEIHDKSIDELKQNDKDIQNNIKELMKEKEDKKNN